MPDPTGYAHDRRVSPIRIHGNDGYVVVASGGTYYVLPNASMGWGVYHGPVGNPNLIVTERGPAIGFRGAADAIGALIGPPKR